MKIYNQVILPLDFQANGVCAGIKRSGKLDLALFFSLRPAKAACLFTENSIKAAPLQLDQNYLKINRAYHGIIANSGNANCFTGRSGMSAAEAMAGSTAKSLKVKKESILVASTGIIAKPMPVPKIKAAIPGLVKGLSERGADKAKRAIMTTDTFAKEISVKLDLGGKAVTISGVAKGAGMIAPNLATMLVFIFTDVNIAQGALDKALRLSVADSFNCITVDGCMSTNDQVILLANGAAGNRLINGGKDLQAFIKGLKTVCLGLAKMIVRDAEGATKFITINVSRAKNAAEARKIALSVANSNLFKTAIYAESRNFFGRTVGAVGASGIAVKEKDLKVKASDLRKKYITLEIDVKRGSARATIYTADLTHGYVKINAEYN